MWDNLSSQKVFYAFNFTRNAGFCWRTVRNQDKQQTEEREESAHLRKVWRFNFFFLLTKKKNSRILGFLRVSSPALVMPRGVYCPHLTAGKHRLLVLFVAVEKSSVTVGCFLPHWGTLVPGDRSSFIFMSAPEENCLEQGTVSWSKLCMCVLCFDVVHWQLVIRPNLSNSFHLRPKV